MKRKFSKILGVGLTLALLTSLLLTAAPVSADVTEPTVSLDDEEISATTTYSVSFNLGEELPLTAACLLEERGDATATWVTTAPTGYTGTDAVKFTTITGSWNDMAKVHVLATEMALDTIATEADLEFTYYSEVGAADPFPSLYLDTDDDGVVDYAMGGKRLEDQTAGAWVTTGPYVSDAAYPDIWKSGDFDFVAGAFVGATTWESLAAVKALKPGATLLYVSLEYGDEANAVLYVDKVTIKNRVYDLEETPTPATITITFPEETVVPDDALADATIQASPGWIIGQWENATTTGVTFEGDDEELTVIATLGPIDEIGEGATVRIEVPGITNPDEPGDYTLEVSTSAETDLVESETYTIEVPDVGVLPGVVELYNPNGVLMDSDTGDTAIQDMLDDADEGWTIKIGEGEYSDDIVTVKADVIIEGDGDVEDIIVEGTWTIDEIDITIDGITIDGDIDVTAADFTLEDCIIDAGGTVDLNTGAIDATIEDCTFNVEDDTGIEVNAAGDDGTSITDCIFNVEEDGVGISVEIGGTDTDVSESTFTGSSGVGINVTNAASVLDVEDSTFDGLDTALDIDAGTVTATGNTIEDCAAAAIIVTAATATTPVILSGNTFTGNDAAAILEVTAGAVNVHMLFNTITDNDGDEGLLIDNNETDEDLSVVNNWWGDAAGPGDDAFSADVVSEPFLAGPISTTAGIAAGVDATEVADFEDDVGVTVVATLGVMDVVAASEYLVNPVAAIDNAVGFWDVYVTGAAALDDVEIRFFTDVTADTEVWVWGESRGEWLEATSYTPNLFSGFILVEVDDTTGIPMIDDLGALPFAVVEPPATTEIDEAPKLLSPVTGDDTVPLRPVFAWEAVTGADGYYFQLADNAIFVLPLVKLEGDMGRLFGTTYDYVGEELPYSTPYHWRVKAVSGTIGAGDLAESDWTGGVFITMDEPVEPTPPVVVEPTPPAPPAPIIEPIVEVIVPAATAAMTPGWIYAIIAVGGVLVIALIVLIVRTRRVA